MVVADPLAPAVPHQATVDQRLLAGHFGIADENQVDRVARFRKGLGQLTHPNREAASAGVAIGALEGQQDEGGRFRSLKVRVGFTETRSVGTSTIAASTGLPADALLEELARSASVTSISVGGMRGIAVGMGVSRSRSQEADSRVGGSSRNFGWATLTTRLTWSRSSFRLNGFSTRWSALVASSRTSSMA